MRSSHHQLDARARHLLRALIGLYVREGEPVGSRTLARCSGLDLSAATVRNVLQDLEELGLVAAPHTSAGRIPTAQGYRLFVDSLLELKPIDAHELAQMQREIPGGSSTQEVLKRVSGVLSQLTHFVGLVTVPKREQFAFRQIDFVALAPQRLLVILVFTDNEVQNRIVELPRPFAAGELERIANYLNQNFCGLSLEQIRRRLVTDLESTRESIDAWLQAAIEIANASFGGGPGPDVMVVGETNLMGAGGLEDIDRLRELFEAFQQKRELLRLLDDCVSADGVRLFIGEESGFAPLGPCTMVTAPYSAGGQSLGVIGVIGPTRMAYERVIPVVQASAQILTRTLQEL